MDFSRISCLLLLFSLGWGAGGGFGLSVASASCGDYVQIGSGGFSPSAVSLGIRQSLSGRLRAASPGRNWGDRQHRLGVSDFPVGDWVGARPREQEQAGGGSPPGGRSQHCEGPSCRGAIPPAPLSTPVETSHGHRELVLVTASDLDREFGRGLVLGDVGVPPSKLREGRWERPPRA